MATISVIIPCYNAHVHLNRAVRSVLNQDYKDFDIWLIDNNSSDGTAKVIQELQQKYPNRIRTAAESRQGANFARNLGLRCSKGSWLQFLDADDELLPGKFTQQLAAVDQYTDVILGTPLDCIPGGEQIPLVLWEDVWKGLAQGSHCGQTSANLYRRSALDRVNGWDEDISHGQDTDLLLRLLMANANCYLHHTPCAKYHNDAEFRITNSNKVRALGSHINIKAKLIAFLQAQKPNYWKENYSFFYLAIYQRIRMLACYDLAAAATLYEKHLPDDFRLRSNKALKIPAWNAFLVNYLGLGRTERLKRRFRLFVPEKVWGRLKKVLG